MSEGFEGEIAPPAVLTPAEIERAAKLRVVLRARLHEASAAYCSLAFGSPGEAVVLRQILDVQRALRLTSRELLELAEGGGGGL